MYIFFRVPCILLNHITAVQSCSRALRSTHIQGIAECRCPCYASLSAFCSDGKAAGGPLLLPLFDSSRAWLPPSLLARIGIFMRVHVVKENGAREQAPSRTQRTYCMCGAECVCVCQ